MLTNTNYKQTTSSKIELIFFRLVILLSILLFLIFGLYSACSYNESLNQKNEFDYLTNKINKERDQEKDHCKNSLELAKNAPETASTLNDPKDDIDSLFVNMDRAIEADLKDCMNGTHKAPDYESSLIFALGKSQEYEDGSIDSLKIAFGAPISLFFLFFCGRWVLRGRV